MSDGSTFSKERESSGEANRVSSGLRRATEAPRTDNRFEVPLRGIEVDPATRCAHYHGPRDVIAIRFPCCEVFYPCHACHRERTDHEPERWTPDQFDTPAVLCGKCGTVLTIEAYLEADHTCPSCGAAFNPGCARHHDRYFEAR